MYDMNTLRISLSYITHSVCVCVCVCTSLCIHQYVRPSVCLSACLEYKPAIHIHTKYTVLRKVVDYGRERGRFYSILTLLSPLTSLANNTAEHYPGTQRPDVTTRYRQIGVCAVRSTRHNSPVYTRLLCLHPAVCASVIFTLLRACIRHLRARLCLHLSECLHLSASTSDARCYRFLLICRCYGSGFCLRQSSTSNCCVG